MGGGGEEATTSTEATAHAPTTTFRVHLSGCAQFTDKLFTKCAFFLCVRSSTICGQFVDKLWTVVLENLIIIQAIANAKKWKGWR